MQIARIATENGITTGQYHTDRVVTDDGTEYVIDSDCTLLAPCKPGTFYCVGRNYAEKIDQMDYDIPDNPDFFIKPAVSLCAPDSEISFPSFSNKFTYAGELAAVIESECKNLSASEAKKAVKGFTILNDLDCLDQPRRTARKAFDGSAPLGPCIETEIDPGHLSMKTTINGKTRQQANTDMMIFDPFETISFLSERFTFKKDDVISFGSPENPGVLEPGDEVEIWYEGIGTLKNTIVK